MDIRDEADKRGWLWRYEESFAREAAGNREAEGKWLAEIPCEKGGILYQYGDASIALMDEKPGRSFKLLKLAGTKRYGGVVVFPLALLDTIGERLDPQRDGRGLTRQAKAAEAASAFPKRRQTGRVQAKDAA
jgi:hypothetical protein